MTSRQNKSLCWVSTLHTSEGAQLCKGVVLAALHRARWCECDALGEVRLELEEPVLGEDRAPLHLPPVSALALCSLQAPARHHRSQHRGNTGARPPQFVNFFSQNWGWKPVVSSSGGGTWCGNTVSSPGRGRQEGDITVFTSAQCSPRSKERREIQWSSHKQSVVRSEARGIKRKEDTWYQPDTVSHNTCSCLLVPKNSKLVYSGVKYMTLWKLAWLRLKVVARHTKLVSHSSSLSQVSG